MSIGTPPHYDSFVFQRRGGGDCAGGVYKLTGRAGERQRRAAEKQKKWRGCLATIDMALLTELGGQHAVPPPERGCGEAQPQHARKG